MSVYDVLLKDEGKYFLLGNEAIVRGMIEAGVGFAATYPGTPSSEVGDVLSKIAKQANIYFEYSTNEIVALETVAAAAASGVRAFTFMKHVGVNVAADALMSVSYTGTNSGLVIMSGDDPSMFSSQNEQDNRHYAEISYMPLIEPSNPQEAKDFLIYSFDLSEKFGTPVLFRTTTRISHLRGLVNYGKKAKINSKGHFQKNFERFTLLPSNAYKQKDLLLKRYNQLREESEISPLNREEIKGTEIGIITSGAAYNSVKDAIIELNQEFDILKLGFTFPLPEKKIAKFLNSHKKIIIFEELDPFLESKVRMIAQFYGIKNEIYGKLDGFVQWNYEFNPDNVMDSFAKLLNIQIKRNDVYGEIKLPQRPPVLCPGCPHRATFYALKLVVKQLRLKDPIFPNDIGCYSLGYQKPYQMSDYLLCMGSSVGSGCGFSQATDQPVIAFIGDSTFFHAGIPGLINAVHNGHRLVLLILDNRTTAMTGHQPNPGLPFNAYREPAKEISIEEIVKGIGVNYVKTVDPYDLKETMIAIREAVNTNGVSVIIAKRECALLRDDRMRKNNTWVTYTINQEKCTKCMNCVKNFTCPAIYVDKDGSVKIDPVLCDGCGVCSSSLVCAFHAIEKVEP
ncbi:MAG: indolepyruvate ferredoxin oxidoreductase subunit alpha [Thermoplasmata archaeon]|nr:indolepyruvate ferredoxin oxidoreductase subunit alpha [Staphylococcus epidermidis]